MFISFSELLQFDNLAFELVNCHLNHHNRPMLTREQFRYGMRCRAQRMAREMAAKKVITSHTSGDSTAVATMASGCYEAKQNILYSDFRPKLSCIRYAPIQGKDASTQTNAAEYLVICKAQSRHSEPMVVSPIDAEPALSPTMQLHTSVIKQPTVKRNKPYNPPLLSLQILCKDSDTQIDTLAADFNGKKPCMTRSEWV